MKKESKTEKIIKQIHALDGIRRTVKASIPFMAVIYGYSPSKLPKNIFEIEDNYDREHPNFHIGSDDIELLKKFCVKCQEQFQIYTNGVRSHSYHYNEKTRKFSCVEETK